jgi:hypothetical protein
MPVLPHFTYNKSSPLIERAWLFRKRHPFQIKILAYEIARMDDSRIIPSPSLVGQMVTVRKAVLLALVHHNPNLPKAIASVVSLGLLPITVAGPRRPQTGLPY